MLWGPERPCGERSDSVEGKGVGEKEIMASMEDLRAVVMSQNQRMDKFLDEVLPQTLERMTDRICGQIDKKISSQRTLCGKEIEQLSEKMDDSFERWSLFFSEREGKAAGEALPMANENGKVASVIRWTKLGSLPILIVGSCLGLGILFASILAPEAYISMISSLIPQ